MNHNKFIELAKALLPGYGEETYSVQSLANAMENAARYWKAVHPVLGKAAEL